MTGARSALPVSLPNALDQVFLILGSQGARRDEKDQSVVLALLVAIFDDGLDAAPKVIQRTLSTSEIGRVAEGRERHSIASYACCTLGVQTKKIGLLGLQRPSWSMRDGRVGFRAGSIGSTGQEACHGAVRRA